MVFSLKKKLQRRSVKPTSRFMIALTGAVLLLFAVRPVNAQNLVVAQPTDFWFNYENTTTFTARTYQVPNHPSDPQLWLYNSEGSLVFTNDDWYGLQSFIQIQVEPGWYRLRAGVCCGQPDVWGPNSNWNLDYELEIDGVTNAPTTSTSTTVEETTTTVEETTTTTEVIWTTTSSTLPIGEPSTTPLPTLLTTTVPDPPTTTTSAPTTTTLAPPPLTTVPATTLPSPPSTIISTTTSVRTPRTIASTIPLETAVSVVEAPTSTNRVIEPQVSTTQIKAPDSVENSQDQQEDQGTEPGAELEVITPEKEKQLLESFSETATPEQVENAILDIANNLDVLTDTQLDKIALTVSKAPKAVKQKFEAEINIFGGGLDNYTPVGSTVTVGERRALVVIGAVLTAMPVIATKRK